MQVVYHTDVRFIGSQPLLVILDKRCNACLQFKDFDAFGDDNLMQGGLKTICKECRKDPSVKSFSAYLVVSPSKKICTKCLKPKLYGEFNKMQDGEEGLHWYCRQCQSEYNQRHRIDNLDDYHTRAHIKNRKPENKARRTQRHQERSSTDPHYLELRHQSEQRYYKKHPIEHRERYNRYMARKREATVEYVDYALILERDGWVCHICHGSIDPTVKRGRARLEFDHVIPLSPRPGEPQGTHSESNIKPSHKICNRRKWNKPLSALTDFDRRGP